MPFRTWSWFCVLGLAAFGACSFPKYDTQHGPVAMEPPREGDAGAASCEPGTRDCNGAATDGCETTLGSEDNCRECGDACTNEHGLNACHDGACEPTCAAGYADCDLHTENGCETNVNDDSLNCGACGKACPSSGGTPLCVAGVCGISSCNAGFGDCKNVGRCTYDLATDVSNCGQCGHACSGAHGTPSCNAGQCELTCESGYGDCNGDATDGCETKLNVPDAKGSVPNCGGCGQACIRRAYTSVNLDKCAQGECFRDCMKGAYDCDNQRNDPACLNSGCGCDFTPCK